MKKKFVLTLALVLMVAASLMAATPVEVSGDFYAGYHFNFNPNSVADIDATAVQVNSLTVAGDTWSLALSDITWTGDNDDKGTLTIDLGKALAANGTDMGDLSVKVALGNIGTVKPSDVYTDTRDGVAELEMSSTLATKLTIGYGSMVTAEVAADPTDTTNTPILLGVKVVPVDGVSAAFGYTNYSVVGAKGGITASATADVAKLAGLKDLGLKASAILVSNFDAAAADWYAEVQGSYDVFSGHVELRNKASMYDLQARVKYAGIKNVGLYGRYTLTDMTGAKTSLVEGGASYKLGGVTYALDLDYTLNSGAVRLSSSVAVSF